MAKRKENEFLYKAFQDFLNLCLLQNRSILWPDKEIWTPETVAEVKKRMVDSPIMGNELSFEEKLEKQINGNSSQLWAMICDLYYVYFLPSTFITLERKQKDIKWAAQHAGLVVPSTDAAVWGAQKCGFTRTGQRYHLKYSQFWLLLFFALHVKGLQDPAAVIGDRQEMQKTLDMIIENIPNKLDRATDMRHAMLYMAFPDSYERIISMRDKETILETYRKHIPEPVPDDIDEALLKLRGVLGKKYDKQDRSFDYYQDLKKEWKPQKGVSTGATAVETETGVVIVPEETEIVSISGEAGSEATEHMKIQWLLLKLGNDMGLDIWVANNDKNKEVDGHKFSELPHLKKEIPLTFDEASNRTIRLIDVVWLKGNAIKAAFEIESTTSIYSGILRLADLIAMQPNINIPLYLVAPDERRNKVIMEVNRPVFSKLSPPMFQICRFIPFSSLQKEVKQIQSYAKYLSPDILDKFSESCEVEEEQ